MLKHSRSLENATLNPSNMISSIFFWYHGREQSQYTQQTSGNDWRKKDEVARDELKRYLEQTGEIDR